MEDVKERKFGFGSLVFGVAAVGFVAYLGYKINKKRDELRNTVELLTDDHVSFVGTLESLVENGKISQALD